MDKQLLVGLIVLIVGKVFLLWGSDIMTGIGIGMSIANTIWLVTAALSIRGKLNEKAI